MGQSQETRESLGMSHSKKRKKAKRRSKPSQASKKNHRRKTRVLGGVFQRGLNHKMKTQGGEKGRARDPRRLGQQIHLAGGRGTTAKETEWDGMPEGKKGNVKEFEERWYWKGARGGDQVHPEITYNW